MAYTVKLGTFAKNIESTAQPNTTGWADYSVTLKNGADISNPQLEISAAWSTVKDYNYAVMMGRYYWIVGKNMLRENFCVLDLKVDVLATYKTEIGSSSLYILRSSASSDGTIVDSLYPTKATVTYTEENDPFFYNAAPYTSGFFVVNVFGVATAGTSTLWKMTPSEFRSFISYLYANIDGYQFTDTLSALAKLAGGSPTKLVSSAMWFPAGVNFTTGNSERIFVGGWDSGVNGKLITDPIYTDVSTWMDVHKHPQAATRGAYLNFSPYSIYTLNMPLFGSINLDTTALVGSTQIQIALRIDAISGVATARIHGGGTRPILADLTAQLGVPMPLNGQSAGASVAGGIVTTLGSVAAAIATGGAAAPIIGAATSAIGTAVTAVSGASFSTGSSGSILAPTEPIILNSTHFTVVDEDNARNGRPLCQVTTPATLGGFMIAQKGDVVMAGPLPEHEEVKRFLESGFFYE